MVLNEKEKLWVIEAINRAYTYGDLQNKLIKSGISKPKLKELMGYYDIRKELNEELELKANLKDSQVLEEIYQKHLEGKKLGFWEKRELNTFKTKMRKYIKHMKTYSEDMNKMVGKIKENMVKRDMENDKELLELKEGLIDRIIDSKQVLYIEDPQTGEEATKRSLSHLGFEEVLELFNENLMELERFVNGKVEVKEDKLKNDK